MGFQCEAQECRSEVVQKCRGVWVRGAGCRGEGIAGSQQLVADGRQEEGSVPLHPGLHPHRALHGDSAWVPAPWGAPDSSGSSGCPPLVNQHPGAEGWNNSGRVGEDLGCQWDFDLDLSFSGLLSGPTPLALQAPV